MNVKQTINAVTGSPQDPAKQQTWCPGIAGNPQGSHWVVALAAWGSSHRQLKREKSEERELGWRVVTGTMGEETESREGQTEAHV